MTDVLQVIAIVAIAYFAALNIIYLGLTALSWRSVTHHLRKRAYSPTAEAFASPLTPPVSIILPAFNEQAGIVESVHSLLRLRYPELEVVVVNDGSTDSTLEELAREFDLVQVRKALRDTVPSQPVRAAYTSRRHPNLWVVDKLNGGKSDALNCGINAAHYPYFCAVDADAILEEDALLRVALPIIENPELVAAAGGIVRIANGCRIEHGEVVEVGLPKSRLATLQVVEYFRAFLVGRVGWDRLRSLLIISGAFGVFNRSVVEAVGGYSTTTVGEDAELVMRMHRHLRDRGEPYRIEFVPDPVCWTEAPEDMRTLSRQRRRWQRGLAEGLWRHKRMLLNPRFGTVGLLAYPYFLLFELLGPIVELTGYLVVAYSAITGVLSVSYMLAFLVVSILLGMLLSVAALALEEFSFRRHDRGREVSRLLLFAVLENLGYRQLVTAWRSWAFVDLVRRKRAWGDMKRRGLGAGGVRAPVESLVPGPSSLEAEPATAASPSPVYEVRLVARRRPARVAPLALAGVIAAGLLVTRRR